MDPKKPRIACIIPARLESTRLPRKVLLPIGEKTLIQHVHDNACDAKLVDEVYIATDSEEVKTAVESFGGKVIMTPSEGIFSGSDRVAHAARTLSDDVEIVANMQGDEPFSTGTMIDEMLQPLVDDASLKFSTLCREITKEEEFDDPGFVKAVRDKHGNGLYFSRQRIPYPRNTENYKLYEHLGLYGFRREALQMFVSWEPTPLEITESLEMLRIIEHGEKLRVVETKEDTSFYLSVDTKEDLEKANRYYEEMKTMIR
ncbi:MAG: 3-deoxy-manno-octulosonate cytidylyltransferase [Candidatus Hodarchaeota archaeon]